MTDAFDGTHWRQVFVTRQGIVSQGSPLYQDQGYGTSQKVALGAGS